MTAKTKQPEEIAQALPTPTPGETCPCCGRKVPINNRPKLSAEEHRDRRREYNNRPEVQARRKEYNAKRNSELRELRALQRQLAADSKS